MTTNQQLAYAKKGLRLKDVFVLFHLKQIFKPTTIPLFLKLNPLLDLSEKSIRLIINKLEALNLLVKFKTATSLIFIFPFLHSVKFAKRLKLVKHRDKTNNLSLPSKNLPLTLYKYNYIYNIFINNRHNVNIKSHKELNIKNINNKHLDDVIMYNKTNQQISNNNSTKNNHVFVVNKSNYNYLNEIKNQFKHDFPNKNNYLTCDIPKNFNYELFFSKIKESPFLESKNNLGLSWLLKNYDAIINNQFAPFSVKTENQGIVTTKTNQTDFSQREYTSNQLSHLFDDLSDIPLTP